MQFTKNKIRKNNKSTIAMLVVLACITGDICNAHSCYEPPQVDQEGNILPSQKSYFVSRLKGIMGNSDNALFAGTLRSGSLGPLDERAEYLWMLGRNKEQTHNGFLGNSSVFIHDAYVFSGQVIMKNKTLQLNEVPVTYSMKCYTDAWSDCSRILPTEKNIIFSGGFFGKPSWTRINGAYCGNWFETSLFHEWLPISEIENRKDIWSED